MNTKIFIIGLIVVIAIIVAVVFANQFAFNQTELANTPMEVRSEEPQGEAIEAEVPLIEESAESLPTSTDPTDIESDLENLDLSGLDSGLEDLNTETEGL